MSENAISRRSFLAGSAGVLSLAAASGYVGFGAWEQAYADGSKDTPSVSKGYTLCNACPNKCGFTAYTVNGRLRKLIGDSGHPNAAGKLCARGYGYSQIAYSEDRLTDPLKRNDKGEYQAISWDQAFSEIGEKAKQIIQKDGADSLAMVQDPRPSGEYYSKRFINALGSANCYTNASASDLSRTSGIAQAIGASTWTSDVANSKATMFIGRSVADGVNPAQLKEMEEAHENGAKIIIVDPRCNNSNVFADEWLPINPGTDLALVLAMSALLINSGHYDKNFVATYGTGFDEYAKAMAQYTPEWAAEITGLKQSMIERAATELANAAPAASIVAGSRGGFGCQYKNSGETARAVALFNALLGCYNQKGGALLLPTIAAGDLDKSKFPEVPAPKAKIAGSSEYPLALTTAGSATYATQLAHEGKLKGMFFYNSNLAAGYTNPAYAAEALRKLDLSVAIDVQMSETAAQCDYVLPDTSYLERAELPEFISAMVPAVSLRTQVIDVVHPNTKPVDEIFTGLADACGVGQYFDFTCEDLARAQLKSIGLNYDALSAEGIASMQSKAFKYGSTPTFDTPTKKIQFTSDACKSAGLSAVPAWIEPDTMPMGNEFRLIEGKQSIHSHTMTADVKDLMQITKDYDLTAAWINADAAQQLGISDGDEIEITNNQSTGRTHAKVTQRINPTALFLPDGYGCTVKEQKTAYKVGLRSMDFVPFHIEPAYGSAMTHETCVTVKKVGA
ncbi:MAG: molybdopterin-dependent oxidoreductase [Eggerthellaceae bacterium]|nr:molybdopterin-dependent oxidoreductase [Eggerthellaceae bacterium]MCH4220964.1 molybdopterin-dependent oxidoreductase [Eggerthellaceae bacterium]